MSCKQVFVHLGKRAVLIFVVTLLTVSSATLALGATYSYSYRITLFIKDHGMRKQASNVVSVSEGTDSVGAIKRPIVCGEATPISLQNGSVILALLSGGPRKEFSPHKYKWLGSPTGALLERLGLETEWAWRDDAGIRQLPQIRKSIVLDEFEYPDIVVLLNPRDPKTVRRVDVDHLQATLGDGISVEGVTLTPTSDQATRGVLGKLLPWLNTSDNFLDGSGFGYAVQRYQTYQFENC